MAKQNHSKKSSSPLSLLQNLEDEIKSKDTTTINKLVVKEVEEVSVEKEEPIIVATQIVATPKTEVVKKETPKNTTVSDLTFESFFNKDFATKNSEPIPIDKNLKNIIDRLSSTNTNTTQASLASSIIKAWLEEHRPRIEKILKEQAKVDF